MKITFYGHACFGLETQGKHILFDPFISPNPKAAHIDIEQIKADYILLTHAHGDHIQDVEAIAKRCDSTIISNYEVSVHFGNKGFKNHPMNHGGQVDFDFGTLKVVSAVHSSSFPDGSYGGEPVGFVLWNDEGCLYNAGDTALSMDMKLIPMTCPAVDLAVLPIGDNFTMGYKDAAIAAEFVEAQKVLGMHYDTFGFIEIDHAAAKKAFEDKGKALILLPIGDSLSI